jgi:YHS domain-containing protein
MARQQGLGIDMKKYLSIGIAVVLALVITFATVKKVSPVGWGMWGTTNVSSGVALKGHDPVAYFNSAIATVGNSEHSFDFADATWHFANAENRELFAANPTRYAAQFGSFCAFAVSKGFTADIDPEAWHIEADQLYVFADQSVRDDWVAGLASGTLTASEENWKKR